jgi:hypothetical protein
MIEKHVAAGDMRAGAERGRQQNDREQDVPNAKDDVADACSVPRCRSFAAYAGAGLT